MTTLRARRRDVAAPRPAPLAGEGTGTVWDTGRWSSRWHTRILNGGAGRWRRGRLIGRRAVRTAHARAFPGPQRIGNVGSLGETFLPWL